MRNIQSSSGRRQYEIARKLRTFPYDYAAPLKWWQRHALIYLLALNAEAYCDCKEAMSNR